MRSLTVRKSASFCACRSLRGSIWRQSFMGQVVRENRGDRIRGRPTASERVPDERTLLHGPGYPVADYPQTAEVLETGVPRALTLMDPDVDDAEATVLREQGFGAVVMMPLDVNRAVWGLVEVY